MTKAKKTADRPRFVIAQFCDDIRFELGNKVTIVGLYNGKLILQELPALIPRLGVVLTVNSPKTELTSNLMVVIEKDDEIIHHSRHNVPRPTTEEQSQPGHDLISRRSLVMQIGLSPITVVAPCMLRVVVTIDGVEWQAGKLRISAAPQEPSPDAVEKVA